MKRLALSAVLICAELVPGMASAEPAAGEPGVYVGAVTLISGDHVTVRRVGSKLLPHVTPGPGRERMHFATSGSGDRLLVVPGDAYASLNSGRLDPQLFDVGTLLKDGYADSPEIPLLVQGDTRSMTAAGGTASAEVMGITALRQPKDRTAELWPTLRGSRVWLDGVRRPSLDKSVVQVGAPTAWRAGHTGKGVTVAVLDTGIDSTHRDFRGRIAASRDFTGGSGTRDTIGHGTHVASTIAGAGARYRGVAPDARLLIGKVCGGNGCPESAILAGMDWAIRSGAKIVNLSLGGPDFAGDDPLEVAINQRPGTLFVVAAGNDGSDGPETVSSPASADAALAVGAVERSDEIAAFSGRGPRIRDAALKPEIVAPGVEITAARSRFSSLGERGSQYVMLSGTSMATPHVAGAAAVLAEQHPDWTGPQLKAALMASAQPLDAISNYEQGAGRLDVGRAVGQSVYTVPSAVSAGRATWPHEDDPAITRTVTYHNPTAAAQTLALTVDSNGGMFTLSDDEITVPARGQASVQVTVSTAVPASEGTFSTRIVATGPAGLRVTTPIAVDREPESHDLTLRHVDRNGQLTPYHFSFIWGVDNTRYRPVPGDGGVATLRVRRGRYHLDAVIDTLRSDGNYDSAKLVRPTVDVGADTTITFDARQAQPISMTFDRPKVIPKLVAVGYGRYGDNRAVFTGVLGDDFARIFTAHIGDPLSAEEMAGDVGGLWATPDLRLTYNLGWFQPGSLTTGFSRHIRDVDLAQVRATYRAQADRKMATKVWVVRDPELDMSTGFGLSFDLPLVRTEFHNTENGVEWLADFEQWSMMKKVRRAESLLSGGVLHHQPGQTYTEDWNSAVFGPGLGGPDLAAFRGGDVISIGIPMFSDADPDHRGLSLIDSGTTTLHRDGTLVGQSPGAGTGQFDVPEQSASYRLATQATRKGVSDLSTRISCVWTFTSARPPDEPKGKGKGGEPLPLMAVRFAPPDLDDENEQHADFALVPFVVQRQPGVPPSYLTQLTVESSTDDGQTWRAAQVTDSVARIEHPRGQRYISLRVRAADSVGNTVDQTIIRAYRI